MSSAAVIGRQLRQHQNSNRVPGPVVPPTQYRGTRTPTPLVVNTIDDRFDLSIPPIYGLGADVDKKFAQFSQHYSSQSHDFYPHPAHRDKNEKKSTHNKNQQRKKKENSIKFNRHCFCVAFKALSSGIVLFGVGTVMSLVGFFCESWAWEESRLNNGTVVTVVNKTIQQHLHNMTYVGPVMMGLGGIVIVAACILTFEVRDTLGIKDDPKKRKQNRISSIASNNINHGLSVRSDSVGEDFAIPPNSAPPPRAQNGSTASNHRSISQPPLPKPPPTGNNDSRIEKFSSNRQITNETTPLNRSNKSNDGYQTNRNNDVLCNMSIISSSDLSYCQAPPSPADIELSDPEGCSLDITFTKWRARCSCSGSPTNSMLMALQNIVDQIDQAPVPPPPPRPLYANNNRPNRNPKILASIDDLSSIYSVQSSSDGSSPQRFNHHHHHQFSTAPMVDGYQSQQQRFTMVTNGSTGNYHHQSCQNSQQQIKYPLLRIPDTQPYDYIHHHHHHHPRK